MFENDMRKIYTPRQEKTLAPRDYLREVTDARNKNNIESVRFVLPKIGVPGYGHFQVKYRIPVLVEE